MRLPISMCLLAACTTTVPNASPDAGPDAGATPSGQTAPATADRAQGPTPIGYHGGWIVTWNPAIYFVYYGNWVDGAGQWGPYGTSAWLVEHFTSQLAGSAWFSINTWYGDAWGNHATDAVHFGGRAIDRYSQGASLTGASVRAIVVSAVQSGALPDDPWGIYVVLTSPDVDEDGFCPRHCGWHTTMAWPANGAADDQRLYAFVGNPARCPSQCGPTWPSANGDAAGDAMVSTLGHELSEIVTDPHLDAWYGGGENADHCAWQFGATFQTGSGGPANIVVGDSSYLVQENWAPANPGYCMQSAW